MSRGVIRDYFERVAPQWEYWHTKNRYYHQAMQNLVRSMIPPDSRVLEIGSGLGDLIHQLKTKEGWGLNFAHELTNRASQKYPDLNFSTVDVDCFDLPRCEPDYVVMTNMLDYAFDIWDLLENLKSIINENTLILITTNNPVWAPLLRLASKFRLRVQDSPRNFITNKDICSVLRLQGFDIVEEGLALPIPKRIPFVGFGLNCVLPDVPLLRFASSIQYLAARPRLPRPALSCSVIIPCHNEQENICECVSRVPKMGEWTEIIVVDDGSTDGTTERVKGIMRSDSRVRLIVIEKNRGKANAVRVGFAAARGDVLMILDADMAVAPEELPKFFKPLQHGSADFVNGTRLVYPMQGKAMKVANFWGNKAFCYLASWALRQRVSDTLCGTKALFRRDYLQIPLDENERWGDFDLLFGAARLKLRILEVPVHYQERRAGKSKMRVMIDGWLFLFACIKGWQELRIFEKASWKQVDASVSECYEVRK